MSSPVHATGGWGENPGPHDFPGALAQSLRSYRLRHLPRERWWLSVPAKFLAGASDSEVAGRTPPGAREHFPLLT